MQKMSKDLMKAVMFALGIAGACVVLSMVSGCAKTTRWNGALASDSACTVSKVGNQTTITCADGSSVVLTDGANGNDGARGMGAGVRATQAETCPSGGVNLETFVDPTNTGVYHEGDTITSLTTICNGNDGRNGLDGGQGANGADGTNGQNGNSFQVTQTLATNDQCPAGGVVYNTSLTDGNGFTVDGSTNQAVVCNGQAGPQGVQGVAGAPAPYSPITPITPCGKHSSPYKEVLVCLNNGSILASFSKTMSGQDTRLAFIPAGSYVDTDESGCTFNVSVDCNGATTVSWNAGSNQYSSWDASSVTCNVNQN